MVSRRACQYSDIHIYCFGKRKIKIIDAMYGRQSKLYCMKWYAWAWSVNCKARNSLEKVIEVCEGKKSCTVFASDNVFSDPCSTTEKYLEIKYKCVKQNA